MEGQGMTAGQMRGQTMRGVGMIKSAKIKPETKRKVFYVLFMMLLFALIGAIGYFVESNPQRFFVITIGLFLVLGIAHLFLIDTFRLFDVEEENRFTKIFTHSLLILCFGLITYTLAFYFLSHKSLFTFVFPVILLLFIAPLWIMRTFDLALKIPAKEYKQWFYPEKTLVADMENIDTSNIAIITYVFSKKFNDPEITNFQTKAPYDIKLGDLFYFFLQEWNYKYPQSNIEFADDAKKMFGWLFFVKGKWYERNRYLDPDKTIKDNKIKVNEIIHTARVQQIIEEEYDK